MLLAILLSLFVDGKALTENSVIDFGSTNSWMAIDVHNDDSQPVAAIKAGASQYFYAKARGCNDLAPGASCQIWIKFRPFRAESYTGTLTIDTGTAALHYPLQAIYYTEF
jgi:hypothetical protein